jgi:predicted regulator of Ras-like GTPase activity (Roadblock/LC7/MglB family)
VSFLTHLETIVGQVDGAIACSLMGFDGIAIETHQAAAAAAQSASLEITTAWVEYANVLTQLKNAAEVLKTGSIAEVSVNSEHLITLMRMVTPEYFLVLGLKPSGNYGKARYVLRITAPKVKSELQ